MSERVPFCCDYHDRNGGHCLFTYQSARPPFQNVKQYTQADLERAVREARAAAFMSAKDAMQEPVAGTMSSAEFHRGFEAMRQLAIRVINRAADSVPKDSEPEGGDR